MAPLSINYWPGGEIPYEFDVGIDPRDQAYVRDVMDELQAYSAIHFKELEDETFYLFIQESSDPPCDGGVQPCFDGGTVTLWGFDPGGPGPVMTIGQDSWDKLGTLRHELLHVAGLTHEQQRPDRVLYVDVKQLNISPVEWFKNYFPLPSLVSTGPYDFGSVMHYGACAGTSCDPKPPMCKTDEDCHTMEARPDYYDMWQLKMGNANQLSPLDVYELRASYPESHFRFVYDDPLQLLPGNGTGALPWKDLTSALEGDSGSHVFIVAGTYSAQGTWDTPMTLDACVPLDPDGKAYDFDGDDERDVVVWE